MAVDTGRWCQLVDDRRLSRNQAHLGVALIAAHIGMTALQREAGTGVVIENGRNPALHVVTIGAYGFSGFDELRVVRVFVALLAHLSCSFELDFLGAHRHLVAGAALHDAVRAEQREFCFGMIETVYVDPGAGVVAGFAAERRSVGAALRHAVVEFAMMRVRVAGGASHVREAEGHDFVGATGGAGFMAVETGDGGVSAGEWITRSAVLSDGEGGAMEVRDGVAGFAFVQVGRGGELKVVLVLVAIEAGGEFYFVDGVFTGGDVAFPAFNRDVFSAQRIGGIVMLFDAEE